MSENTFAITLTVKDEWEMLRYAIPYYLSQGASKIYLFLDGTSDPTRMQCSAFPLVEVRDCVDLKELSNAPNWVRQLNPNEKMDHRKRINTLYAAEQALSDGIEWISCLDPDEIVQPEAGQTSIKEMVAKIPANVDQIIVPNLELLPFDGVAGENPFSAQTLFLCRQDRIALLWRGLNAILRRWLSPRTLARLENVLYRVANRGQFPPAVKNPVSGAMIYRSLFLGYKNSKAFMRTSEACLYNFNIHKWQGNKRRLKSVKAGRLLHYDLPSFGYFLKKFRQRPANMQLAVFDTRYQISQVAREASIEVAHDFYRNAICCPDQETAEELVRTGIAIWVSNAYTRTEAACTDRPSPQ